MPDTTLGRKFLNRLLYNLQHGPLHLSTNLNLSEFFDIGASTLTKIQSPKRNMLEVELLVRGLLLTDPQELIRMISAAAYDGIPMDANFIANVILNREPHHLNNQTREDILILGEAGIGRSTLIKALLDQALLEQGPCIYLGPKGTVCKSHPNLQAIGLPEMGRPENPNAANEKTVVIAAVATAITAIIDALKAVGPDEIVTVIVDTLDRWVRTEWFANGEGVESTLLHALNQFPTVAKTRLIAVDERESAAGLIRHHEGRDFIFAKTVGMRSNEAMPCFRNGMSAREHPLAQLGPHDFVLRTEATGQMQRFNPTPGSLEDLSARNQALAEKCGDVLHHPHAQAGANQSRQVIKISEQLARRYGPKCGARPSTDIKGTG
jgi:hypothetical protein